MGNDLTGADQIDPAQLAWEMDEVHRLDPSHKAMRTSYDGWNVAVDMLQVYGAPLLSLLHGYPSGHPQEALDAGDALGLDLYVEGPSIPLDFTSVELRAEWKQQALSFMQAQPWGDSTSFTPTDLVESAVDYGEEQPQVVLMWGVETWLDDPAWLAAAHQSMDILRAN